MEQKPNKTVDEHEKEILEFWKKDKTFEKSLKKTQKSKPYVFYDGPPFATGLPHYGHILASVLKDAIPRFWTMNNRYVRRVWGWDCHGLPIENIAEAELKIKSKDEIEKMGVKKFNDFCRSKVLTYVSEWKKTIDRIGRWTEFDNSYKTMDNEYIESVWWAFKTLYEKDLMYEGEKILMYCPRCATPLSKSEIAMDNSYKKVKDKSITIKFKLKDENVYALAWTTTPWTLPSNLALAVNSNLTYSYIKDKSDNIVYLIAKNRIKSYFKSESDYSTLKEVKGKELENKKYLPLFPYFEDTKNAFKIILGDFVTAEDGTGIVHTAPAFGEDDYLICKKNNICLVQPVDDQGKFTEDVVDFKGEYIFNTNSKIIETLKKEGKIVKIESTEHEYPFCYRCDTPLIYRAIPSWFVNIQKVKDKILKLNKKINWYPEFLKEGRFKNNVETAPDWNVSRNRFWASAIPIWQCEDEKCKNRKVIGSIKELEKEAIKMPKGKIDLHKDFLDQIKFKCTCGKEMSRVPEVLDCWFESGSMPFAQFHYPFENKSEFEKNFPSQFVAEYIGQTRAWFYYMLAISTILFDEIPFENVLTTGTILAEDGTKMSKSKNNYPDPWIIFKKYGVDALRFYLLSTPVMSADNLNFSERGVDEVYKKIILLLYNTSKFYEIYDKEEKISDDSKEIIDQWIISRLNESIQNITEGFEIYNTVKICNEIKLFVDDLSTWYVRACRDRFNEDDKQARRTLSYVLENLSKVIAPIMPFVSEKIYKTLKKSDSVHLQDWPKANNKKINKKVLESMKTTREIVSASLKERDNSKIPLKQPLSSIVITGVKLEKDYLNLIEQETNVKSIKISKGEEFSIKLDTRITPELEAEGYAREVSRKVQAERKKAGLVKSDVIELEIISEFNEMLRKHEKMLKERIGAKKIIFESTTKKYNYSSRDNIKQRDIEIKFNKI